MEAAVPLMVDMDKATEIARCWVGSTRRCRRRQRQQRGARAAPREISGHSHYGKIKVN